MKKTGLALLGFLPLSLLCQTHSLNYNWHADGGGPEISQNFGVSYCQATGDVISAGYFEDSLSVNGTWYTNTPDSAREAFVISRDAGSGTLNWAIKFGGSIDAVCYDVKTDATGNIYVGGYFTNNIQVGSVNISPNKSDDGFIASFNSSGTLRWFTRVGGSGNGSQDRVRKIDVRGNYVYVTGDYKDDTLNHAKIYGNVSGVAGGGSVNMNIPFTHITTFASTDIFIARLSTTNGNPDWVFNIGSDDNATNGERAYDIKTDSYGTIAVTGVMRTNNNAFDVTTDGSGTTTLLTEVHNNRDAFLAVYRDGSSPTLKWAVNFGCTVFNGTYYIGNALAFDASGNIYWGGEFSATTDLDPSNLSGHTAFHTGNGGYDVFLSKLDSTGNFIWGRNFGGIGNDYCRDLCFDETNNRIYMAGSFSNTIDFGFTGSAPMTSSGLADYYVAVFNLNGYHEKSIRNGSTDNEGLNAIDIDGSGGVYVAGSYEDSFDVTTGVPVTDYGGSYDILNVKYDYTNFSAERASSGQNDFQMLDEDDFAKPAGIRKKPLLQQISAYPVPSGSVVYIDLPASVHGTPVVVKIQDTKGQVVQEETKTAVKGLQIDLSKLGSAPYLIHIEGKDLNASCKVIKE